MGKFRFPGLNAYSKEDSSIFKGRDTDAKNLLQKINLHKTLVLHADSGIGKSSLIQAGLLPLIEKTESDFAPVVIRMTDIQPTDNDDFLLVRFVIDRIHESLPEFFDDTFKLLPDASDSLWVLNKQAEKKGKTLLLILDQFEYINNFKSHQREALKKALFDLVNSKIPVHLYASIEEKMKGDDEGSQSILPEEFRLLSEPGKAKILFVVREDKLGTMSLLDDLFPDILKNDFSIDPLSTDDAFIAIKEPAQAEGDFDSKKFSFATDEILTELIDEIADKETKLVDPIQLQIVARDLERNIVIKNSKDSIEKTDIPELSDIINKFYSDCWNVVKSTLNIDDNAVFDIKKKIVNDFYAGDKRHLFSEDKIPLGNARGSLKVLKNEGLIREVISDGTYYQLTHDRLVQAAKDDKIKIDERRRAEKAIAIEAEKHRRQKELEARRHQRQKKRFVFGAAVLIGLSILAIFFFINRRNVAEYKIREGQVIGAAKILRRANQAFGYEILKHFANKNTQAKSSQFNNLLSYYEQANFSFQTGVYQYSSAIVALTEDTSLSNLTVTEPYSTTTWNTKTGLIEHRNILTEGYYLKKHRLGDKAIFFVVTDDDSLKIQDSANMNSFQKVALPNYKSNITLSPDGRLLVVENRLYIYRNRYELAIVLPFDSLSKKYGALTHTFFLNRKNQIAAAFSDGALAICEVTEDDMPKIKTISVLESTTSSGTECLATDSKSNWLFVGTDNHSIEVWNLDYIDSNQIPGADTPIKILRGHGDVINTLSVSPDDSFLLSGSDDKNAILWDCHTWQPQYIKTQSKVQYAGFLTNSQRFYTAADDERLFTWSRDKASKLFNDGRFSVFSPFDYYNVGLKYSDFRDYDTVETINYFTMTLHYIMSVPLVNEYKNDSDYKKGINESFTEIRQMFRNLTSRKDYKTVIPLENRKLLSKTYNVLEYNMPELLLNDLSYKEKITSLDSFCSRHIHDQMMPDTLSSDIQTAIQIAKLYYDNGTIYKDSGQFKDAVYLCKKGTGLLEAYYRKFSSDPDLKNALGGGYGYLSFYCVFANENREAIYYAQKGIDLDSIHNDWIKTNLVLGLLFNKEIEKADRMYRDLKNASYHDSHRKFRDAFLDDFSSLESAGILKNKDSTILNEITKVKQMLTH
jgi:WD40 repeat protein